MKNLVFLKPFSIKNPTLDEQNDFMMNEIFNQVECTSFGEMYDNDRLYGQDLETFIPREVKAKRPDWVIAVGKCATVALGIKRQKKILLNPKVSFDNLNNVSEFDRENTYGFFDDLHERDYERFQTVFPHAMWFPQDDNLTLFTIKEVVEDIIND